jgi:formylglycine-generating enzyme required for sulfatase activity
VKLGGLVVVLAIAGSLSGASACGSRTGIWLFDEVGADSGTPDGMLDSPGDVMVADASVCIQNPETSECCGFGTPSGGYSCEVDFGSSLCGPDGWTCPSGGTLAVGCSFLCMVAPDAGLADAPSFAEAGDYGPEPPSCARGGNGMTNCGPGGSGTESCCTSLEVEGGTYFRTYDPLGADGGPVLAADGGPTEEADPATVSGFLLDKYLVTVGRFRQFVAAWNRGYYPANASGKHTHLNGGQGLVNVGSAGGYESGWDATDWNNTTDVNPTTANLQCASPYNTWTDPAGSNENLPINCVTWYESYAFCIWDGGFLPSEAEREYAAAGGSQQLEYPWGSTAPGTMNQYAIYGDYYTGNATEIAPVGTASLGAGYWNQLDLAGEVYEWNLDWYALYAACTDCANTAPAASARVFRGGDFSNDASYLLPSGRGGYDPTARYFVIGFRCARTP